MEDGDSEHDLVMPFVACRSNGGSYDDNSYVAGYEMGILEGQLYGWLKPSEQQSSPGLPTQWRYIHDGNADQVDLIAMRHGWSVEIGEAVDGWLPVRLVDAER